MKKLILGFAIVAAFISAGVLSFQQHPTAPRTEPSGPEVAALQIPSLVVAPAEARPGPPESREGPTCKPNGISQSCSSNADCCSGCCGTCGAAMVSCVAASCCQ